MKPGSEAQANSDSTNQSDGCPDISGIWHFRHGTFIFDGLTFSPPKSGSVRVIITRETGHTGVFMIGTYDCGHLELKCASSLGTEGCETVTEIISADFDPSTRTFKGSWRYHFQDNKANDRVGEFECFQ